MKKMRSKDKVKHLFDLIECLPSDIIGLEIGSYAGESAEIFMQSSKFKRLYCVDPWYFSQSDVESKFDKICQKYDGIIKNKGTLRDFKTDIEPVDFIYIDARHEFIPTLKLVFQSLLFAKEPCFLGGHDYRQGQFPGVTKALNMIIGTENIKSFGHGNWLTIVSSDKKTDIITKKP